MVVVVPMLLLALTFMNNSGERLSTEVVFYSTFRNLWKAKVWQALLDVVIFVLPYSLFVVMLSVIFSNNISIFEIVLYTISLILILLVLYMYVLLYSLFRKRNYSVVLIAIIAILLVMLPYFTSQFEIPYLNPFETYGTQFSRYYGWGPDGLVPPPPVKFAPEKIAAFFVSICVWALLFLPLFHIQKKNRELS